MRQVTNTTKDFECRMNTFEEVVDTRSAGMICKKGTTHFVIGFYFCSYVYTS